MPEYGEKRYWEERYSSENEPFDWMCDWDQLEPTIRPLLVPPSSSHPLEIHQQRQEAQPRILIVGCGNAPFSSDMYYKGNFTNQINIDYCDIVIRQQQRRWPALDWRVMDALKMDEFDDGAFDVVIDKSLIDTTMCYKHGETTTMALFREIHRVLKPGGRLITISLHSEDEVVAFRDSPRCEFAVTTCQLVNVRKRRDEQEEEEEEEKDDESGKSLYHTFAVFDKLDGLSEECRSAIMSKHPLRLVNAAAVVVGVESGEGTLKKFGSKRKQDKPWDPREGIVENVTTIEELVESLDAVLEDLSRFRRWGGNKETN